MTFSWGILLEIIKNAADILILAFVIYKVLIFMKDNRALQLVKGLLLLIVLYYASEYFQLNTIQFLLKQSWTVLIIAVVVIFQPELRGLLERLGGGNLLNQTKQEPKERLIGELMKALKSSSASKTGLLIVIEGKTGLREYIETGTVIDARCNSTLLGNLFFKNAPLHDGAVILRGNRVAAAGCILPLSLDPDIDPSLGTRHRAAIGITEVCDGLAIVVSEENGAVSVAYGGKLYHRLGMQTTEKMIRDFYYERRKKKKEKASAGNGEKSHVS